MMLHVNWGHASAQRLRRGLAGSDWDYVHLFTCVGGVLRQREGCRPFDKAPHAPIAVTSAVAIFNETFQEDLLLLGDVISPRSMDVFSKFSPLIPVRKENPREVWDACRNSWIGVSGPPQRTRMDEGWQWRNEVSAELRPDRRIKLLLQGAGAHPGFSIVATLLREEFAVAWWKMTGSLADRSPRRYRCAWTLSFLADGFLPSRWFLDPTR